ncbi:MULTISPECIES: hypothetical protein [Helicobacter]|uniref:Uncharacterized protein n=1 Tax=Helicobacter bilis ATCC 43879 TaxID=613026 RepID=C3XIL3_9HELI|nr:MULTISPECIES: hypothetical protein [Helicobacter]EEO24852.1 hypothetical protein HRAG_01909 [Helicobacter bilis ATCC 43879]
MPKNNPKNTNILSKNAHIDSKRREAIKDLRDLSLLGAGSILGLQIYKDSKTHSIESHFLDSYTNTLDSTSLLESNALDSLHSLFHSNIPNEILSLPLKYFNVPQTYTMLLESKLPRNQRENLLCIVPLLTSKDFKHTMPSLYHHYNVENNTHYRIYNETSQFLQYHYDTLGSLLKDLQSHHFIARDYRALSQDSNNLLENLIQEIMQNLIITNTTSHISLNDIRRYQVPKDSSLYKEFKNLENEKDDVSAIDAYNEALEILADYKDYYFTNTRSGKPDKNKARRLLECLDIIGRNNIKALYVGTSDASKNMKRPKFIGRLATTIIIEDGLWLG